MKTLILKPLQKRSALILWLCELLERASEGEEEFLIPEEIADVQIQERSSLQQVTCESLEG